MYRCFDSPHEAQEGLVQGVQNDIFGSVRITRSRGDKKLTT